MPPLQAATAFIRCWTRILELGACIDVVKFLVSSSWVKSTVGISCSSSHLLACVVETSRIDAPTSAPNSDAPISAPTNAPNISDGFALSFHALSVVGRIVVATFW
jgi:hypothetical protein